MKRSLLALAVVLALSAAAYQQFISADWLRVRRVDLTTGKWPRSKHVRLLVLNDVNATRQTRALYRLDQLMRVERPDIILFAGGALGDPAAVDFFRKLMGGLYTPIGRYAVRANADRTTNLFAGGPAIELLGLPVNAPDDALVICGVPFGDLGAPCLEKAPRDAYVIFLSSTADQVESLFPRPDLYVTGTADVGLSRTASQFPPGGYEVNGTALQVGAGFTPHGFTRPEITIIDLQGTN